MKRDSFSAVSRVLHFLKTRRRAGEEKDHCLGKLNFLSFSFSFFLFERNEKDREKFQESSLPTLRFLVHVRWKVSFRDETRLSKVTAGTSSSRRSELTRLDCYPIDWSKNDRSKMIVTGEQVFQTERTFPPSGIYYRNWHKNWNSRYSHVVA